MTKPQEGDLVRIVTEGVVAYTHPEGGVILENHYEYFPDDEGVISIEVIAPPFVLPTKQWAQVVDGEGFLWTRHTHGDWWTSTGHWDSGERLITQRGPLRVISGGVDDE
jgi:hypothetical protein